MALLSGMSEDVLVQGWVTFANAVSRRYLVHSIATYYGLHSWSVSRDNPARREAYVGLKHDPSTRRLSFARGEMPQPLWAVV